jgi:hypothetical protein
LKKTNLKLNFMKTKNVMLVMLFGILATACSNSDPAPAPTPTIVSKDINTAEKVSVDRFSDMAGKLFKRSESPSLPAVNASISFDNGPFITTGLDKSGAVVKYYNFDVQTTTPDDIYVFFKTDGTPVAGQNNVIPTIPGDKGYNDFWIVNKVIVPSGYVPNSLTSEAEILDSKYPITKTDIIVNCPVVPFGSTAAKSGVAGTASKLTLGWYNGKAVSYFEFNEASYTATASGMVKTSPIYVMFNIDPLDTNPASGPASGFKAETGSMQTHNVLATLPADASYSPLWSVQVIGNANFTSVKDLATATALTSMEAKANVNCPIVK